jgi:hypothetical protein
MEPDKGTSHMIGEFGDGRYAGSLKFGTQAHA